MNKKRMFRVSAPSGGRGQIDDFDVDFNRYSSWQHNKRP